MITNIVINNKPYSCVMCSNNVRTILKPKIWSGEKFFLEKLKLLESSIGRQNQDSGNSGHNAKKLDIIDCIYCKKKNISRYTYTHKNIMWNESLYHYVEIHHIKPPSKFIRFVLDNDPTIIEKCKKSTIRIKGKIRKLNKFSYVKIKANQLMILDALMEHGGISPKYKEKHEIGYKYSEHAGMLEFDKNTLNHVIISSTTARTVDDDPEIFFPTMGDFAYDYEYIFHTHPPTPIPGGRIKEKILYEFPSTNDLYHFIEHFNNGRVQGSLVITPEGLYNIRKYHFDKQKIKIDTTLGTKLRALFAKIQEASINKFKKNFDAEYFYSVIAQDTTAIDECNELLKKYELHIDYFPRQKTNLGQWIIGTIYLPICLAEKL